ncbi:13707_t:CDS:2 [Entrophospora sp. SA101]|nr:13707_t:CDS:2 [Entrophospora sp. SA101]
MEGILDKDYNNNNLIEVKINTDVNTQEVSQKSIKPHNGKSIKTIICSPNLKYVATFSEDDNSIVGWLVDDVHLKNDRRLEPETFFSPSNVSQQNGQSSNIPKITSIKTVSDQKFIVFESNLDSCYYLFVISYENDQIYLFSLNSNEKISELTCKTTYSIILPKLTAFDHNNNVAKYFVIANSNLLINNGIMMASQWDLTKMRFELQYFSDISLPNNFYKYNDNHAIFNKDKTLLAVYLYVEKQLIIYSTAYGTKLTTFTFVKIECDEMVFIYTEDNTEHLFVALQDEYITNTVIYRFMDPYNLNNFTDITEIYTKYLFKDNLIKKHHKKKLAKNKVIKVMDNNFIFLQEIVSKEIKLPNSHLKNFNHLFLSPFILENHYDKESGYLKLKHLGAKLDEYDYFKQCTHFLLRCKILENDDLLLITRLGMMIFSVNLNDKIYLKYFWNDCIEQEKKHWMRHESDKQYIKGRILKGFDSFKTSNKLPSPNYNQTCISEVTSGQSFSEGFANFKKLNRLPPLNYNYIFDNYDQSYAGGNNISRHPFRDMLLAILEDISSFTMFADEILICALDNHKGSIVELVCDKCLNFLQQNPEMNLGLLTFLVNKLPKLSKHYPGVVKRFLEQTSMLLDPSCKKIFISDLPSHYGYCYDIDLYRNNFFWNLYFLFHNNNYKFTKIIEKYFDDYPIFSNNYEKYSLSLVVPLPKFTIEEIHQKIQSIDKNKDKYEHPPIISDKLRELVGIPVQKFKKDLSKQYEEIKNDFKSIQESYVELKNQLDANNKFMIYRLKENNEYLIEKLTNKT